MFREILERYPAGRFAERAAWKAGWWAYRQGQFTDALQYFDQGRRAVSALRLSAVVAVLVGRAAQQAGDVETGVARLRLTATDYHNSYYGRLAVKRLARRARRRRSRRRCSASRRRRRRFRRRGRIASLLSVGPQSRGDERAAVRAARVGRFAAAAGDDRADAQAARQRARRHQRDEARLSAVPRRRRRDAAARRSCR